MRSRAAATAWTSSTLVGFRRKSAWHSPARDAVGGLLDRVREIVDVLDVRLRLEAFGRDAHVLLEDQPVQDAHVEPPPRLRMVLPRVHQVLAAQDEHAVVLVAEIEAEGMPAALLQLADGVEDGGADRRGVARIKLDLEGAAQAGDEVLRAGNPSAPSRGDGSAG